MSLADTIQSLISAGNLSEAISVCAAALRDCPSNVEIRESMCALLCYSGEWERARAQLRAWAREAGNAWPSLMSYEQLLTKELSRQSVLTGATPPSFYEPMSENEQAQAEVYRLWCQGRREEAAENAKRLPKAPTRNVSVDGKRCGGFEDFDQRFASLLEVILPEGYTMVPISRIRRMTAEEPRTHFDAVWRPVELELNGGRFSAYLPVRYPFSEQSEEGFIRLGQKTACHEVMPGFHTATGRHFFVGIGIEMDFDVLSFKEIVISDTEG